jgi:hypothetical protein
MLTSKVLWAPGTVTAVALSHVISSLKNEE